MQKNSSPRGKNHGLQKKIRHGRQLFRIAENTQYYSAEDYKQAEKQFVKQCIIEERCAI